MQEEDYELATKDHVLLPYKWGQEHSFLSFSTIAMHKIKIVSRDCEVMMWNGAKMI